MARVITKVGDVFSVLVDEHTKKYFQYFANDLTQLNSDVIRVFVKKYALADKPDLSEVVKESIDFFAHTMINPGVKRGLWEKVGSCKDIGTVDVYFRVTNDGFRKLGEEPIKISHNWYIWKINDDKFTRVGTLTGQYKKAEIGLVFNPNDIVHRIRAGEYDYPYPGFE